MTNRRLSDDDWATLCNLALRSLREKTDANDICHVILGAEVSEYWHEVGRSRHGSEYVANLLRTLGFINRIGSIGGGRGTTYWVKPSGNIVSSDLPRARRASKRGGLLNPTRQALLDRIDELEEEVRARNHENTRLRRELVSTRRRVTTDILRTIKAAVEEMNQQATQ